MSTHAPRSCAWAMGSWIQRGSPLFGCLSATRMPPVCRPLPPVARVELAPQGCDAAAVHDPGGAHPDALEAPRRQQTPHVGGADAQLAGCLACAENARGDAVPEGMLWYGRGFK